MNFFSSDHFISDVKFFYSKINYQDVNEALFTSYFCFYFITHASLAINKIINS